MQRKTQSILLLFIVSMLLVASAFVVRTTPKEQFSQVTMFDVGQGDSFLIQTTSGHTMLIDGGKDTTVLGELARALPWFSNRIDVVLATHPDLDHIGGLDSVLQRYRVGMFLTSNVGGDTEEYRSLRAFVTEKNIPAYFVYSGMTIRFSPTEYFAILFPDRDVHDWETNTGSVVGKFVSGDRSILFTGDSPAPIEQYLATKYPPAGGTGELDIDILKLGHHGSRTSTTAAYLKATTPSLALISAGKNNSYGHPHKEVLDLLKQFNVPYISTQTEGTVTFKTDGTKWWRE